MREETRSNLYTVLIIVVTAAIFFSLGLAAAGFFGVAQNKIVVTEIEPEVTTTTTMSLCIDLNTATVEDLVQVPGVGKKTAESIIAYREEIGGFKYVEQLLYVKGIGEAKYNDWVVYFTVGGVDVNDTTTTTTMSLCIDLNTATVEDLVQVPGIGEKTAASIIAYREEIGGFKHVEQLLSVAGVGETKYNDWIVYFTVDGVGVSNTTTSTITGTVTTPTTTVFTGKYHLNRVTVEELMNIKSVGEKTAQAIVTYREQIGGFTMLEQLMEIEGIGEKRFAVLCEYLTLDDE